MNDTIIASLVSMTIGILLTWGMGWARTYLARRVAVSTPTERRVKRLHQTVARQGALLDAVTDRQAMHAQATILLANAVKTGDKDQIERSLNMASGAEAQFVSFLSSRMTLGSAEAKE